MWDRILVAAIITTAVAAVAYRLYRTATGRSRCDCSKAPRCPARKLCEDGDTDEDTGPE